MASPFDDLDRKRIDELARDVKLLVKMVAIQQDQLNKLLKRQHRLHKLQLIRLRVQLSKLRDYVKELETINRLPYSK